MLIYTGSNIGNPFRTSAATAAAASVGYKNVNKRKRRSIRTKVSKRGAQRRKSLHKTKKKQKRKRKSLTVKNVKFLKKLGLRVRKH